MSLEELWAKLSALKTVFGQHRHTGSDRSQQLTGAAFTSATWAGTSDLADVVSSATGEAAGTATTVPRGDHRHAIAAGSIVNADVNGSAAIAYSKLNLTSSIVNADVSTSAAITPNKFDLDHFSARRGANTAGVTGNGTAYTVIFDTSIISNAAYSTSTGTYTAPATGAYQFNIIVSIVAGAAAQTNGLLELVTTARTYRTDFDPYTSRNLGSGVYTASFSTVADMTANDTATVRLTITGGPGDSAIVGGGTTSVFSGFRIA